jgi:glutathione S-transferase
MHGFAHTALVTLLALIIYFVMGVRVARARGKYKVAAPATTGDPQFERHFRVQMNTLEWLPIFLPSLWLFALYWDDRIAALIGVFWVIGRFLYMTSYVRDPKSRGLGFGIQGLAALVLLFGALIGVARALELLPVGLLPQ